MLTAAELASGLRQFCLSHADPALVIKYSRYFREGVYDAYGISQSLMRAKLSVLREGNTLSLPLLLEAAPLLMESGKYEETAFLLSMLNSFDKDYNRDTFRHIENWFSMGIRNWAHADILGMQILPQFMKKGIAGTSDFDPWLSSEYAYQRRCVPVTYIKLLKQTGPDYRYLFGQLEVLMTDPQRVVQQGMGWFLREAWKIRKEETEAFLAKWKDRAPRLIFQYACEKMGAEDKLRFRKKK